MPNLLHLPNRPHRPNLTQAQAPLLFSLTVVDEAGQPRALHMPAERALTVYVDKQEIVTLMTLGQHPEWLVLGYLYNQNLIQDIAEIDSLTVDWDVASAAVKTRTGQYRAPAKDIPRVVTSGCGQGSMFSHLMTDVAHLQLPATQVSQSQLFSVIDQLRDQQDLYKQAGSVHGCALFDLQDELGRELGTPSLALFVEDVGRHNALDTLSGWSWLQARHGAGRATLMYTTGRLTSEMVIKAAQMGIAVVVSRSGMTQMGWSIAQSLGLCAIGRAKHRRYLCFAGAHRLIPGCASHV